MPINLHVAGGYLEYVEPNTNHDPSTDSRFRDHTNLQRTLKLMWTFTHEATIDAQPERVFELISGFSGYAAWNPFVLTASGPAEMEGIITGTVKLGFFKIPYRHKIFNYAHNQLLCWRDFGLFALLYCGQRCRCIEVKDDVVNYRCDLMISGPLSGLAGLLLGRALCNGIIAETRALMAEACKRTPKETT
jgi:hypothetical protein